MESGYDNRMQPGDKGDKDKKKPGDKTAYKKPTKPKTFKWEGKHSVTLPHVGVVIPGATFTVQPEWERIMVFCIRNDKFTEVK